MNKKELVKLIVLFVIAILLVKFYALIMLIPIGIYVLNEKGKFDKSKYGYEAESTLLDVLVDTGRYGEYLSFIELEKLNGYYKIVANAYVPKDNGEDSEIDLVVIHEKGIFAIESKNYSGWIYGDDNRERWTTTYSKYAKRPFHNPVWQNETHIKWLQNYLGINNEYIYSFIVFSERCSLKNVKTNKKNTVILQRPYLAGSIRSIAYKNRAIYDKETVDKLYYKLKRCTYKTEEEKQKHIDDINMHNKVHSGHINPEPPDLPVTLLEGEGIPEFEEKSYMITAKLYLMYQNVSTVAKERGLTPTTIQNQIVMAYKEGFDFGGLDLIPAGHEQLVRAAIAIVGTGSLKAIKAALPSEVSYLTIKLVLSKQSSSLFEGAVSKTD